MKQYYFDDKTIGMINFLVSNQSFTIIKYFNVIAITLLANNDIIVMKLSFISYCFFNVHYTKKIKYHKQLL